MNYQTLTTLNYSSLQTNGSDAGSIGIKTIDRESIMDWSGTIATGPFNLTSVAGVFAPGYLYINKIDADGVDISDYFNSVLIGDRLRIVSTGNATVGNYGVYEVTNFPIDNGITYEIQVQTVDFQGEWALSYAGEGSLADATLSIEVNMEDFSDDIPLVNWADDAQIPVGFRKEFELEDIPSGQWKCSDSGDAANCYIDPTLVCGDGGSCEPITYKTTKLGYHRVITSDWKQFSYFTDNSSVTLKGSNIYTASMAETNKKYYFGVTDGNPNSPKTTTQFDVTWGHIYGSGSVTDNNDIKGASEAIYKQYASALLGETELETGFLISSGSDVRGDGSDGNIDRWIYVLNFKKKLFRDNIQPGTWTLSLKGGSGPTNINLTDDSLISTTTGIVTDAGRRFNIIKGTAGVADADYNVVGGRYGWIYPDVGIMVFGEKLSNDLSTNPFDSTPIFNNTSIAQAQLYPNTGSNEDGQNALRFVNCMKNASGNAFTLYSEKETDNTIYACRIGPSDFNHTSNFTILGDTGRDKFGGDYGRRNDFIIGSQVGDFGSYKSDTAVAGHYPDALSGSYNAHDGNSYTTGSSTMDSGSQHTFITGVTLWNQDGIPLVIAALSTPLMKNFDRETVIKVKLEY